MCIHKNEIEQKSLGENGAAESGEGRKDGRQQMGERGQSTVYGILVRKYLCKSQDCEPMIHTNKQSVIQWVRWCRPEASAIGEAKAGGPRVHGWHR